MSCTGSKEICLIVGSINKSLEGRLSRIRAEEPVICCNINHWTRKCTRMHTKRAEARLNALIRAIRVARSPHGGKIQGCALSQSWIPPPNTKPGTSKKPKKLANINLALCARPGTLCLLVGIHISTCFIYE